MTNQNILSDENLYSQIRYVSHEIRNHLSICDMYSQIIKKTVEKLGINNSTIDNAISCIQQSVRIMGANLMELKSMNEPTIQVFDFKKTVEKAFEMSKAYAQDKNIEFEIAIKNSANIEIDENRFISSIVNIIKNGIEAIDIKGNITIVGAVDNSIAVIKITNDGKMIPKEKQSIIFESGYTTKNTGNGLGLYICKKYLESQNADLKLLQSTKTKTTFEISIPAC